MEDNGVEEDDELRRAIALSLQDQASPADIIDLTEHIIDLTENEEASAVVQAPSPAQERTKGQEPPGGFLGLDRKAMEQERLARKRKAPVSPPQPSKERRLLLEPSTPSNPSKLLYPTGVVKKTWAFGHPRQDDIKIEEVFDRSELVLAVLSSFQWDMDWLMPKLDAPRTKLVFVMQAKEAAMRQKYLRDTSTMPSLRLCFPPMDGQVQCMHSKLMLLSYPTFLRIVVPTANLVPYDWGEGGIMENTVFLVDLPRLPTGQRASADAMTFFGTELAYFCAAMGLQDDIAQSLFDFDFSATNDMAFVHTIGGTHTDEDAWRRTGYCGLGRAVQRLGLDTRDALDVDFIASSIGAITFDFLAMLYLAAQGDDGTTELGWRTKAKTTGKAANPPRAGTGRADLIAAIDARFRLYFPSRATVLSSRGGAGAGGPICFQPRWYASESFPRNVLRDCTSTRAGLLMHNKILFVRPANGSGSRSRAWVYLGSANCSESAWGKLFAAKGSGTPKLNCRNWECGVVLPVRTPRPGPTAARSLDMFDGSVPVPVQYPGATMDDQTPWFYGSP